MKTLPSKVLTLVSLSLIITACATNTVKTPAVDPTINPTISPTLPQVGDQNNKRTNQACIDLIKEFEGVVLTAYMGPGGNWLIGYGHKAGVFEGMTITAEGAERILREDLLEVEANVNRLVIPEVNHNQFSALVCLAYNIGWGNFANSTLLKKLNEGDFDEAARQFGVWRMIDGNVSSHLEKRRLQERDIFES